MSSQNRLLIVASKYEAEAIASKLRSELNTGVGHANLDSVRLFNVSDYWLRPDGEYDYNFQKVQYAEIWTFNQFKKWLENRSYAGRFSTAILIEDTSLYPEWYSQVANAKGYLIEDLT